MAHQTGMSEKNFTPSNGFGGRWLARGLQLFLLPRLKRIAGLRDDRKSHVRMLQAAELGALPVINSRPVYLEPESRRVPRQQVAFAGNVWCPKAMDYVFRIRQNDDWSCHRNMNLVG